MLTETTVPCSYPSRRKRKDKSRSHRIIVSINFHDFIAPSKNHFSFRFVVHFCIQFFWTSFVSMVLVLSLSPLLYFLSLSHVCVREKLKYKIIWCIGKFLSMISVNYKTIAYSKQVLKACILIINIHLQNLSFIKAKSMSCPWYAIQNSFPIKPTFYSPSSFMS